MKSTHLKISSTLFIALFAASSFAQTWVDSYKKWSNIADGNGRMHYNWADNDSIPNAHSLEALIPLYGKSGFKYIRSRGMTSSEIRKNNENLKELAKLDLPRRSREGYSSSTASVKELSMNQIYELYQALVRTPVVINQRDYGDRGVGFCFGRAVVAHHHALVRGVHPGSIRKLWVVGDMGFWGFHVTTLVKGEDNWYAIDNYTGVMNVDDWIERMKTEHAGGKPLTFFISRASRFSHAVNNLYNPIDLFNISYNSLNRYKHDYSSKKRNDFYQGFFMDFFDYLANDVEGNVRKFRPEL